MTNFLKLKSDTTLTFEQFKEERRKQKGIKETPEHIKELYNIYAKLIAAAVRNNIEKFHIKYLSDAQMKELNPLIRNGIYTALINLYDDADYFKFYAQYVPDYWEDCELAKD